MHLALQKINLVGYRRKFASRKPRGETVFRKKKKHFKTTETNLI